MPRIADAELERLKASVPVAGLIEASGVKLSRRGSAAEILRDGR